MSALVEQSRVIAQLQKVGMSDGMGMCSKCGGDVFETVGTSECIHVHRQAQGLPPVDPPREPPEDPFEGVVDEPQPEMEQVGIEGNRASALLNKRHSGKWLMAHDFPPPEWVVDGVLPEGTSALIAAPKIGKSWWVLDLAISAVNGTEFLGVPVRRRPVLYFAFEDGWGRLQSRADKLTGGEIPDDLELIIDREEPEFVVEAIGMWLKANPRGLVIVDTLGVIMPDDNGRNAYKAEYKFAGKFVQITNRHRGSAIVVVHHDRKDSTGDFVDSANGSRGITGAVDTILSLKRKRDEAEGTLELTGREVGDLKASVNYAGGKWSPSGGDIEKAVGIAKHEAILAKARAGLRGERSKRMVEFVIERGPVTPEQVAEFLDMRNEDGSLQSKKAQTYLDRHVAAGRLSRPEPTTYTGPTTD